MSLKAPNSAYNLTLKDATAMLDTLTKAGIIFGGLFVNATVSGPGGDPMIPLSEVPNLNQLDELNYHASTDGVSYHSIGLLKQMWAGGGINEFRRVYQSVYPGRDGGAALLNIPAVGAAVSKALRGL